jgi:carboxyl-terminal processing protease
MAIDGDKTRWMDAGGRRLKLALGLMVVLAVAGCSQPAQLHGDPFGAIAEPVIRAGYTHIANRYVEPVSMSDMSLAGMEGMSRIDPRLHVARDHDHILLTDGKAPVQEFSVPKDEDPAEWAALTVAVLESGRAESAGFRAAGLERTYEAVFDGALSHLDRFSRYAPAAVAREQRAQRDGFGGIGITVKDEDNEIRVVSVVENSPSAKAGIEADDAILAVDGEPTSGLKLTEVVDRLRGPIGSAVRLKVMRALDSGSREVTLRRALIVPTTVSYEPHGDVAYIRVASFNQRTTSSLEHALHRALREMGPKLRGVVLDMRGNPGGLLDQAVTVSDLFLTRGRILSTSGRHPDSNQTFDAAGFDLLHGLPLAILVNGTTASAAEVVAAALQDQGRAIVVGTSSYGKGTVQTVHRLPNDGEIIITWSRIHAPSGYTLNHVGVIPNICTSKADANAAEAVTQVIDLVRSGRIDTAAARLALHTNMQPNKAEIRLLRSSCPPRDGDGKLDLEVAQRLIEDKTLFARAIQPGAAPEIAKTE